MRTEIVTPAGVVSIQHRKALSATDVEFVTRVSTLLGAGKKLRWQRQAQEFMAAHGALHSLVHVDWQQRASNADAIDAVIGEMIKVAD